MKAWNEVLSRLSQLDKACPNPPDEHVQISEPLIPNKRVYQNEQVEQSEPSLSNKRSSSSHSSKRELELLLAMEQAQNVLSTTQSEHVQLMSEPPISNKRVHQNNYVEHSEHSFQQSEPPHPNERVYQNEHNEHRERFQQSEPHHSNKYVHQNEGDHRNERVHQNERYRSRSRSRDRGMTARGSLDRGLTARGSRPGGADSSSDKNRPPSQKRARSGSPKDRYTSVFSQTFIHETNFLYPQIFRGRVYKN